jgi:hypothetical protein
MLMITAVVDAGGAVGAVVRTGDGWVRGGVSGHPAAPRPADTVTTVFLPALQEHADRISRLI